MRVKQQAAKEFDSLREALRANRQDLPDSAQSSQGRED